MANTSHFRDEQNPSAGGWWTDEYNRQICTWAYDPTGHLDVWIGSHRRRVVVEGGVRSAPDLGLRLARLALEQASQVLRAKYDP
jgi:hypothetical protein